MTVGMKHEPDIALRTRRLPDANDFRRAKSMYAAGKGIEHIVMGEWLLTWGKPGFKDFPIWLDEQDG